MEGNGTGKIKLRRLKDGLEFKNDDGEVIIHKHKLLSVFNGNVLVFKKHDQLTTDMLEEISNKLAVIGLDRCIIVVVNKLSDIKTLDTHQMGNYGWVRKQESEENLEASTEETEVPEQESS